MAELGDWETRKLAVDWAMRLQTVTPLSSQGVTTQTVTGPSDAETVVKDARVFLEFLTDEGYDDA